MALAAHPSWVTARYTGIGLGRPLTGQEGYWDGEVLGCGLVLCASLTSPAQSTLPSVKTAAPGAAPGQGYRWIDRWQGPHGNAPRPPEEEPEGSA